MRARAGASSANLPHPADAVCAPARYAIATWGPFTAGQGAGAIPFTRSGGAPITAPCVM